LALGLSAALALAVGIAANLSLEIRALRRQLIDTANVAQTVPPLPDAVVQQTVPPLPDAVVQQVELAAIPITRDAGKEARDPVPMLRLSKTTTVVEITLVLNTAKPNARYTATLLDEDGAERASHYGLAPQMRDGSGLLTAIFASALLPQGSFVIRLKDSEGLTVESYAFNIRVE
jgi:hypothetical protein